MVRDPIVLFKSRVAITDGYHSKLSVTYLCGHGGLESAFFSSFHVALWQRRLSQKWQRGPWQRSFLGFSRGSVSAKTIAEVAAEAQAAHFSRVFMWFYGRGSYR